MTLPRLENSYLTLPADFFSLCHPVPVKNPSLVDVNKKLMAELGLKFEARKPEAWRAFFAGNQLPTGTNPVALAYAGHQFGYFVPRLGDGRAHLLGEVQDASGKRWDIQLKGSGRTDFSRHGDGRAPLGPVIREYLLSEAMHALGIPTTRSLALVATGETVMREGPLPGGIVARVANSHLRIGSFEYLAARGDVCALKALADYAITRLYPDLARETNPYLALLEAVMDKQAHLVAAWMAVGFIHGVMNTDNTSLSGETIDYGPCAFMEDYQQGRVFSSIDLEGRYAYGNQAVVMRWNLACLANALLPLLSSNTERAVSLAHEVLSQFESRFKRHWLKKMAKKLGLMTTREEDATLIVDLLALMEKHGADFTCTFRQLLDSMACESQLKRLQDLFKGDDAFTRWHALWQHRLSHESNTFDERVRLMRESNPVYVPRNHLVAKAIEHGVNDGDFDSMRKLLDVLASPYQERAELAKYARPAKPWERVESTFCGT